MNYFPVGGVSGKIKVDGKKVDSKNINFLPINIVNKDSFDLPYLFCNGGAVIVDGKIHIMGGATYISSTWAYYNYHYVLEDSTWKRLDAMPYSDYLFSAVVLNGEIHILGGHSGSNGRKHYKWDGTTWTQVSTLPAQLNYGSAVVLNNEIHILGGGDMYSHHKWDGTTWTQVSRLPYGFTSGSAVVLNNEIHILGGETYTTYHYKWNGSAWVSDGLVTLGSGNRFDHGSAVVYHDAIHALGGNRSSSNSGNDRNVRLNVIDYAMLVN